MSLTRLMNGCESTKNFLFFPQRCSNNIIVKIIAVTLSIFAALMTLGMLHLTLYVICSLAKRVSSTRSPDANNKSVKEVGKEAEATIQQKDLQPILQKPKKPDICINLKNTIQSQKDQIKILNDLLTASFENKTPVDQKFFEALKKAEELRNEISVQWGEVEKDLGQRRKELTISSGVLDGARNVYSVSKEDSSNACSKRYSAERELEKINNDYSNQNKKRKLDQEKKIKDLETEIWTCNYYSGNNIKECIDSSKKRKDLLKKDITNLEESIQKENKDIIQYKSCFKSENQQEIRELKRSVSVYECWIMTLEQKIKHLQDNLKKLELSVLEEEESLKTKCDKTQKYYTDQKIKHQTTIENLEKEYNESTNKLKLEYTKNKAVKEEEIKNLRIEEKSKQKILDKAEIDLKAKEADKNSKQEEIDLIIEELKKIGPEIYSLKDQLDDINQQYPLTNKIETIEQAFEFLNSESDFLPSMVHWEPKQWVELLDQLVGKGDKEVNERAVALEKLVLGYLKIEGNFKEGLRLEISDKASLDLFSNDFLQKHLISLHLSQLEWFDESAKYLGQCDKLRDFIVEGPSIIEEAQLTALAKAIPKSVTLVKWVRCELSIDLLALLKELPHLTSLSLCDCVFNDNGIEEEVFEKKKVDKRLYYTKKTDDRYTIKKECCEFFGLFLSESKLEVLDLSGTKFLGDHFDLPHNKKSVSSLKTLKLDRWSDVNAEFITLVAKMFPMLESLSATHLDGRWNTEIPKGVKFLVDQCKNLKKLEIDLYQGDFDNNSIDFPGFVQLLGDRWSGFRLGKFEFGDKKQDDWNDMTKFSINLKVLSQICEKTNSWESLDLCGVQKYSDERPLAIELIKKNASILTHLSVANPMYWEIESMSWEEIYAICECSKLTSLNMSRRQPSSEQLEYLMRKIGHQLTELYLAWNYKYNDQDLSSITHYCDCNRLKKISLAGSRAFSNEGMGKFLEKFGRQLEHLHLDRCEGKLTGKTNDLIIEHCKKLKFLSPIYRDLTVEQIKQFLEGNSQLQEFYPTNKMDEELIEVIKTHGKQLRILNLTGTEQDNKLKIVGPLAGLRHLKIFKNGSYLF